MSTSTKPDVRTDTPDRDRSLPEFRRALKDADAKLDALAKELDPEAPWEHPDARALDTITFDEWLRRE